MRNFLPLLGLFLFISFQTIQAQSQLFVDSTQYDIDQMVMDFLDSECVTLSNIDYIGDSSAIAYFVGAATNLDVPAGILLSSGNSADAAQEATAFASDIHNLVGDPDLEALNNNELTFDAAILTFDLTVSQADTLSFRYVFASEEYPEFVNSNFNDVFAFIVTDSSGQMHNIATLPDSMEIVAINSVNHLLNAAYYRTNNNLADVQNPPLPGEDTIVNLDIVYDGMTVALDARFYADPGQTYHIKIALADVADKVYDSSVFLGINSLCGSDSLVPPAQADLQLQGDSLIIENLSRYAQSFYWDFDDGTFSEERNPGVHVYEEAGEYTIKLTTTNYCCSDTYEKTVTVGDPNSVVNPAEGIFMVYPNPADDFLQIELVEERDYNYQILDATGRTIRRGQGFGSTSLDVRALGSGLYWIQIQLAGETFARRVNIR